MLGDHIRALKGGRWVHGIDLGDQRILHLVEDPGLAPGLRLRRVFKPEFTAGASRVELVVHRERAYPARAVVARAWSRFMDPSVVAMFRDSEQFAAWCKVGRVPEVAPPAGPPAPKPAAAPAPKAAAPARPATKKAAVKKKVAVAKRPARKAAAKKAPKAATRPAPRKGAARKAPKAKAVAKKRPAQKAAARRPKPAKKKGRR